MKIKCLYGVLIILLSELVMQIKLKTIEQENKIYKLTLQRSYEIMKSDFEYRN